MQPYNRQDKKLVCISPNHRGKPVKQKIRIQVTVFKMNIYIYINITN